ncbi:hypothetical protein LB503_010653 [Fusarium chuoi]|nr:hypothetical protein LB503_010653 [Fusarium chuoi]
MLQKYPEGYIFEFESQGPFTHDTKSFASVSEEQRLPPSILSETEQHIYEQRELQKAFNGARYVAFIPIWDPVKALVSIGAAQQNIAHLIGTCCRTLLDTTEHLLDFTNVNQSLGSDTIDDGRSEESTISTAPSNREQILNKTVHLDQIAEDAVESLSACLDRSHLQSFQQPNECRRQRPSTNGLHRSRRGKGH